MKKNWKRILAAFLAASMIFGDTVPVFATESSDTVVEASETEEVAENVETVEAAEDEETVEVQETTEETVVESIEVSDIEAESEEDTPDEKAGETEESVIEEETVELEEITENEEVETKNTSGLQYIEEDETVTFPSTEELYNGEFYYYFVPESDGWYYLNASRDSQPQLDSVDCYNTSTNEVDTSTEIEYCFKFYDYATSVYEMQQCFYLTAGNTYQIKIYHNLIPGVESTFKWSEKEDGDTAIVYNMDDSDKIVAKGELALYRLTNDSAATGVFTVIGSEYACGNYYVNHITENYAVPVQKETAEDESWQRQAILLTPESKVYVAVSGAAFNDVTVSWENVSQTLEVNQEISVSAGTIASYEFKPESDSTYEITNPSGYSIYRVNKNGTVYSLPGSTSTDANGNSWKTVNTGSNIEKIIIAGKSDEAVTIQVKGEAVTELETWSGSISLQPGEEIKVSYSEDTEKYKEFLMTLPEGVEKEDVKLTNGISSKSQGYSIDGTSYVGYELSAELLAGSAEVELSFKLKNTGDSVQSVEFKTDYTICDSHLYSDEEEFIYSSKYDADSEEYFEYFYFSPYETAVYTFNDNFEWGYSLDDRQPVQENCNFNRELLEEEKIYLFKFSRDEDCWYEDCPVEIVHNDYIIRDDDFEFDEYVRDCFFTPSESGIYGTSGDEFYIWNKETRRWDYYGEGETVELEADTTYLIWGCENSAFGLKRNITVLDFDYYEALIQSGGSVSIGADGKVSITQKSTKFKLVSVILSFFGIVAWEDDDTGEFYYGSTLADSFAEANTYWKTKKGDFVASEFYRLDESGYEKISAGNIKDGDVVLVKYEPEIVWVDSLEVSVENTTLNVGDSESINVIAKAATEKYPLKEEPKLSYKSSNPYVVSVDDDGYITALKEGKATITIAADVAKRYKENIPETIVETTITIYVGNQYCIQYENVFGKEGTLADDMPTTYNPDETTELVDPVANEGYEFAGWYSDAKLTKKITSIAKGSKGDKTVYAKWQLKEYSINYELNGGKFEGTYPTSYTLSDWVYLAEPIRHGYFFGGWYRDEECTKEIYSISKGTKKDTTVYAQWYWNAYFELKADTEDGVVTHPYNTATGDWECSGVNLSLASYPAGILADINYYSEEWDDDYNSLELKLYWDGAEDSEEPYAEWNNSLEIDASMIKNPGTYRVEGTYCHTNGEFCWLEPIEFTVQYEKREYPVDKEIEWTQISGFEDAKTFDDIRLELAELMHPTEDDDVLNKDLGEGLVTVEKDDIIIKNSKNKEVKYDSTVASGTYTVIMKIGDHDRYFEEATSTLKLSYGTLSDAGVNYTALSSVEESEERVAGATIALSADADGTPINATPYTTGVIITPVINTPWGAVSADELAQILDNNLNLDGESSYAVKVDAKETTSSSKKAILTIDPADTSVSVTGNGEGTGTRTLTLTTSVYKDDDVVAVITSKISSFTVTNGGKGAVKELLLNLFMIEDESEMIPLSPIQEDSETKTYLIAKDSVKRNYTIEWDVHDYANSVDFEPSLKWQTSSKKLATVKAGKNHSVALTIPANAQGVADITVTANDAGKKSMTIKLIIVDTAMRLDTTSLTVNSLKGETGIAYLYPNVTAAEMNAGSLYEYVTITGIYEKVKGEYVESSVLTAGEYNIDTGELEIGFTEPQAKSKTYTAYIGVENSLSNETENYALKIKDTCALPKTPKIKVTKNLEVFYKNGYAELQLTTYGNIDVTDIQTTEGQKFVVTDYDIIDWDGSKTIWSVKVEKADPEDTSVDPSGNSKSKTTKNVEFAIWYDGYEKPVTVKTNITVTKSTPKTDVYGYDTYAPVFYPDADIRQVQVAIPISEDVFNVCDEQEYLIWLDINDETGDAYYWNDESVLEVSLSGTDKNKFKIVDAYCLRECSIVTKNDWTDIGSAVIVTMEVLGNTTGTVKFDIRSEAFADSEQSITTNGLKITARKVSSESISFIDSCDYSYDRPAVKSLTFSDALAGKESITLACVWSDNLQGTYGTNYFDTELLVEGADKNSKKIIDSNALLVEVDGDLITITSTDNSFNYKNCKLKVTMLVSNGDTVAQTKSTTITLNFKKALTPSVTLSAKGKLNPGLWRVVWYEAETPEYSADYVQVNAKFKNAPVGAQLVGARFADIADNSKYYMDIPEEDGTFYLNKQSDVQLPLGKDKVDIIYDFSLANGEIVSVKGTVTITVADSLNLKSSAGSINLYNTAKGAAYGKEVVFYDAKSVKAVKVMEIVNEDELKAAGISFENMGAVSGIEFFGGEAVKFYVDENLARGIEKTYTVKVKVAVIDAVKYDDDGNVVEELTGTEKIVTFKINLKN